MRGSPIKRLCRWCHGTGWYPSKGNKCSVCNGSGKEPREQ